MTHLVATQFQVEDLDDLVVQPAHSWLIPIIRDNRAPLAPLMENDWAFTLWNAYGRPVAAVGIVPDVGYEAWALLGEDLRRCMVPVTRFVQRKLREHAATIGPVRARIDENHANAVRWAEALGFHREQETWLYDFTTPVISSPPLSGPRPSAA